MQTSRPSSVIRAPGPFWAVVFKIALLLATNPGNSAVHEVRSIGLTVNDLDGQVRFFSQVLSFVEESREEVKGRGDLLGFRDGHLRVAQLRLGSERITLTEHAKKGRPIPSDSRSHDHWFQHIAIVVRDMDAAYAHLRRHKVKHISTGPQVLPAWNTNAAGIQAFYFRGPEDHVLEIIWFPPGKGDSRWQQNTEQLFLGIDHTAIVVADTEKSLEFYRDLLGLRVAGESENYGIEQEHLNQVFGARLRITGLRAASGPGIEFLEYLAPPGGRPAPVDVRANDLVFWRTSLAVEGLERLVPRLREKRARSLSRDIVSISNAERALVVFDPDGHGLQFNERGAPATAVTGR